MNGQLFRSVAAAVLAYLLGGFNGAIIISKLVYRCDVRRKGSGNAGLTNFYRCFGGRVLLPVLLIDLGKGAAAVALAAALVPDAAHIREVQALAMLFVILGHMYPLYFSFRGGKGVLTGVGALLVLDWRLALIQLAVFALVLLGFRYVSLASILAAGTMPLTAWYLGYEPLMLLFFFLCCGMVVYLHRGNIQRLAHGTENRFHLHKTEER